MANLFFHLKDELEVKLREKAQSDGHKIAYALQQAVKLYLEPSIPCGFVFSGGIVMSGYMVPICLKG